MSESKIAEKVVKSINELDVVQKYGVAGRSGRKPECGTKESTEEFRKRMRKESNKEIRENKKKLSAVAATGEVKYRYGDRNTDSAKYDRAAHSLLTNSIQGVNITGISGSSQHAPEVHARVANTTPTKIVKELKGHGWQMVPGDYGNKPISMRLGNHRVYIDNRPNKGVVGIKLTSKFGINEYKNPNFGK